MYLTFWNQPDGEAFLDKAISSHGNAPPWYFIGKFAASLMRDDIRGAFEALDKFKDLKSDQPMIRLLSAAYNARVGNLDLAKSELANLQRRSVLFEIPVETLMGRMPVAPEVRAQLTKWLEPALA